MLTMSTVNICRYITQVNIRSTFLHKISPKNIGIPWGSLISFSFSVLYFFGEVISVTNDHLHSLEVLTRMLAAPCGRDINYTQTQSIPGAPGPDHVTVRAAQVYDRTDR